MLSFEGQSPPLDRLLTKDLQRFLQREGYHCGGIDGAFGTQTATAFQMYLAHAGLCVGSLDGDFGKTSVKALQTFLKERDLSPPTAWIDGVFGPSTVLAVQRFLRNSGSRENDWSHNVTSFMSAPESAPDVPQRPLAAGAWHPSTEWSWDKHGASPVPPGFHVARAKPDLVGSALSEVLPHLLQSERSIRRAALEVGWTLGGAKGKAIPANSLITFPCLRALICDAMEALGSAQELDEDGLNISCLLYTPGTGIPMHRDRPCYKERVYGCILLNTSDRSLEFARWGKTPVRYVLQEAPGTCFLQTGEARYRWTHAVEPLTHGERVSVTWRWFESGVACR